MTSNKVEHERRVRVRLLGALLISLAVGLLLAEGSVRLAVALGWVDLQASPVALPVDEQVQLAPQPGSSQPPLHVGDPLLHHRLAANWSGYFPEEIARGVGRSQVPIRTNSLGLRGPELAQPKPADTFRILALGDSVTFGWGLRVEDTYPSQLASQLASLRPNQRFEVVNAGVSGYGTWQELLWLQEAGLALQPDVVVVQAHLNDASDNLWGALAWRGGRQQGWLLRSSLLARLLQRALAGSARPCSADWKVDADQVCWQTTEQLLDELHAAAEAEGAAAVLMPAPMRWQVEAGAGDGRSWVDAARYQDELRRFAQGDGWLYVDPLPAFQQAKAGQTLFLDAGHPNETGQKLMAQALYAALSQAGALP